MLVQLKLDNFFIRLNRVETLLDIDRNVFQIATKSVKERK